MLCSLFARKMGSCYKKEIFNDHVQKGVLVWAEKVKTSRRGSEKGLKGFGAASKKESTTTDNAASAEPSVKIEMAKGGEDAAEGVGVWAEKLRTSRRGMNKGVGAASKKESTSNAASGEPSSLKVEMAKAGEDAEVVENIE